MSGQSGGWAEVTEASEPGSSAAWDAESRLRLQGGATGKPGGGDTAGDAGDAGETAGDAGGSGEAAGDAGGAAGDAGEGGADAGSPTAPSVAVGASISKWTVRGAGGSPPGADFAPEDGAATPATVPLGGAADSDVGASAASPRAESCSAAVSKSSMFQRQV